MAIAYAVYRAGRRSLTFYKGDTVPRVDKNPSSSGGSGSSGSANPNPDAITAVFTGIETSVYTSSSQVPWYQFINKIITIDFVDTISPISTAFWFSGIMNVTSINVEKLNMSNVTTMESMFYQMRGLETLDLSTWDTSKIENMRMAFTGMRGLKTIYVSDFWNTEKVTNSVGMFGDCSNLVGGNGTTYNNTNVDVTYARIDKSGEPGYFTLQKTYPEHINKDFLINGTILYDLANAVRKIKNISDNLTPAAMVTALENTTINTTTKTINIDWSGDMEGTCYITYYSNGSINQIYSGNQINTIEVENGVIVLYDPNGLSTYGDNFITLFSIEIDSDLSKAYRVLIAQQDNETIYAASTNRVV